jgi:hypothetical protein
MSAQVNVTNHRAQQVAHRQVALGGRHPEVGAAGVEDDGEPLRRCAIA